MFSGALTAASFGKNLCRLCIEPINDLDCFLDLGSFNSSTAWVLRTYDVVPFFPIRKSNRSHSVFANSSFRSFNAAFDKSTFLKIFSTNALFSILVRYDAIEISCMNAFAWGTF